MYACILLGLVTLVFYYPTLRAEFVRLDDFQYVVNNRLVWHPSWESVRRFVTEVRHPSTVDGYYQPLTMVSLMLDAWLTPGGDRLNALVFHLSNVLLHIACAVLVFLILRRMTGSTISAALVGALFALHPAQVESVAWISQRKTVLATAFAFGSVACYLRFGRTERRAWLAAAAGLFLISGLAKPTTLPLAAVFPLLDIWPLRRPMIRSLPEKWPFAVIAAVLAWIMWVSQSTSGAGAALPNMASAGILGRMAVLLSHNLVLYFGNLLMPVSLSPYRPIPRDLSLANPSMLASIVGAAAFVLICIVSYRRSKPLFVGCVAFLILLAPSLGWLRYDASCVSDRFLYLPLFFLLLPLGQFVARVERRSDRHAMVARALVGLSLLPCAVLMVAQQGIWQSSDRLWTHISASVPDLPQGQYEMGYMRARDQQFPESAPYAARAVELAPNNTKFRLLLGTIEVILGQAQEGIRNLNQAVAEDPTPPDSAVHLAFAEAFVVLGRDADAEAACAAAVANGMAESIAVTEIGDYALKFKHFAPAAAYLDRAAAMEPDNLTTRWNLGTALVATGQPERALREYEWVLREMARKGVTPPPEFLAACERLRREVATSTRPASTLPAVSQPAEGKSP